jgi:hypothetical protein
MQFWFGNAKESLNENTTSKQNLYNLWFVGFKYAQQPKLRTATAITATDKARYWKGCFVGTCFYFPVGVIVTPYILN